MKFLGALYARALVGTPYAVLYPGSHLESHLGMISLPGCDILEFDIWAGHGEFKLAGKAQREPSDPGRGIWEWLQSTRQWRHVTTEAQGSYPCIYDHAGTLHHATWARNGSQGWRYVAENGTLVTGDETLNDQRAVGIMLGLEEFWEYTYLGSVVIGQGVEIVDGHEDAGCRVRIGGVRRRLMDGDTRFIRVDYSPALDMWAVGLTRLAQGDAYTFQLTRAELSMLKAIGEAAPQPPPVVVIEPPELPPVPEIPNQSAVVEAVRAKYPTPLGVQHAACLLEIAREIGHGAGLLRKDSGSNILLPDGARVSQDVIVFPDGNGYDCLGSGETLATPQWSGPVEGSPFPASRYYAVSAEPTPQPIPGPTPTPTPTPQPPPAGDTQARILFVLERIAKHFGVQL